MPAYLIDTLSKAGGVLMIDAPAYPSKPFTMREISAELRVNGHLSIMTFNCCYIEVFDTTVVQH